MNTQRLVAQGRTYRPLNVAPAAPAAPAPALAAPADPADPADRTLPSWLQLMTSLLATAVLGGLAGFAIGYPIGHSSG